MNDYNKQANDFLKKTNTEFSAKFVKHDFYFSDDKEKRDIYEITLKRGNRQAVFNFGQSLNNSGLRLFNKNGERTKHKSFEIPAEILKKITEAKTKEEQQKARISLIHWFNNTYFNLSGLTFKVSTPPTAYDVLACLQKNEVGRFENFCSDFGYDTDSIKAHKIYVDVVKEYDNLKMLYTDEELNALSEIQ